MEQHKQNKRMSNTQHTKHTFNNFTQIEHQILTISNNLTQDRMCDSIEQRSLSLVHDDQRHVLFQHILHISLVHDDQRHVLFQHLPHFQIIMFSTIQFNLTAKCTHMHTYNTRTEKYLPSEHTKNKPEHLKHNPAATNMTIHISWIQPRAIDQRKTAADPW